MAKILLVDDDTRLSNQLCEWLASFNYVVETAFTGTDALQLLDAFSYDLILLDWELPDLPGLQVCHQFRSGGGTTPIIFLTGHGDIDHKEKGLDSGADDYLVKPFDVRELAARVRSLLRRPSDIALSLSIKGVSLDVESRLASYNGREVRVSKRENALLEFMMRHPNRNYSAKTLADSVWPSDREGTEEAVRTTMKTLRYKLAELECGELIKTVLKLGYILEAP